MYGSLSLNAPRKHIDALGSWSCVPVSGSGGSPASAEIGSIDGGGYDCTLQSEGVFRPEFVFEPTQGHFYTNTGTAGGVCTEPNPRNISTSGAAQGASNSLNVSIAAQSIQVSKDGTYYSVSIPEQTIDPNATSLTIPAQDAGQNAGLSNTACMVMGIGCAFSNARNSFNGLFGVGQGGATPFPESQITISQTGSQPYVSGQNVSSFEIVPQALAVSEKNDGTGVSTITVPRRSIQHTIVVGAATGTPPSSPTVVASGASCTAGTPYTISMSGTDADGDRLRYGVDWNNDELVDEWAPPTGYVAGGVPQTASRTYATAGTKTVQVLAQDEGGLTSAWATTSFNCAANPNPTTDITVGLEGEDTGSGGTDPGNFLPPEPDLTLRVIPSLVRPGNTTRVNWSATGVTSCLVTAPNGDTWNTRTSTLGGETSRPITAQTTYTLTCQSTQGPQTKQATVRILPRFEEL